MLYESARYTPRRLADLYQESPSEILSRLFDMGVETRASESPLPPPATDVATMARLYALNLSISRVAELCGYSIVKTHRMLFDAGVEIRGPGGRLKGTLDVPRLVKLYNGGLSIEEAGAQCGISYTAARARLLEEKVPLRQQGRRTKPAKNVPSVVQLYEAGLSIAEVSEICRLTPSETTTRLRNEGIALRAPEEEQSHTWSAETRLIHLYNAGLSIWEAGAWSGFSYGRARRRLQAAGVALRPAGRPNAQV